MAVAELFFPSNLEGVMYEDPTIGTVDNIWTMTANSKKWRRHPDSTYRAVWRIGKNPSGSQTERIQALYDNALIHEVVFDRGPVTMNGTLNIPAGKKMVFRDNGSIDGTVTINGGIIVADPNSYIFKGSVKVNAEALSTQRWCSKWFGAVGNGTGDDAAALQRWADNGVRSGIQSWFLNEGLHPISKGILFRKDNGSGEPVFLMNADIVGVRKAYSNNFNIACSVIEFNGDTFGFGIDRGKGVTFKGIGFLGKNYAAAKGNSFYDIMENPSSPWVSAGVRDDSMSPHAGFVVDPFSNAATLAGKRYPGFDQYYVNTAAGGSTDINIEDCFAFFTVVGFCLSPHETPQNADHIRFKGCWSQMTKVGWSTGQSQNRTISIRDCACWGNCETLIDCRRYGSGQQGTPEVINMNVAGGVKWLCRLPSYYNGIGITFRDSHFESVWGIGGSFGDGADVDTSQIIKFQNCFVNLLGSEPGYNIDGCDTIAMCDTLIFDNSTVLNLNGGNDRAHNITCRKLVYDIAVLENLYPTSHSVVMPFVNYIRTQVQNNQVDSGGRFFFPKTINDFQDLKQQVIDDFSFEEILMNYGAPSRKVTLAPSEMANGNRKNAGTGGYAIDLGDVTVSSVNNGARTAVLQFTADSDAVRCLEAGTKIYRYVNDQFAKAINKHICTVTSVNVGTGVVNVKCTLTTLSTGSLTGLYYFQHVYALFCTILGNVTINSNEVTNVESNINNTFYYDGTPIISPFFPPGTRILSYDTSNPANRKLIMSHKANTTKANISIHGARLRREWSMDSAPYGGYESFGWNVGDIIHNNGKNPAYDNIVRWECIVAGSGTLANTRVSQWRPILKTSSIDENSDVDLTGQADGHVLTLESGIYKPKPSTGAFSLKNVVAPNTNWLFAKPSDIDTVIDQLLCVGSGALQSQRQITIQAVAHIAQSNFTTGQWVKVGSISDPLLRPKNTVVFGLADIVPADLYKSNGGTAFTGTGVYANASARIDSNGDVYAYIGSVTTWPQLSGTNTLVLPIHVSYFQIPTSLGTAATPTGFTVTPQGFTTARLNWNAYSGAYAFIVQRSPDNSAWSTIDTIAGSAVQYDDPGRSPNTQYYYRLIALVVDFAQSSPATGNVTMPDNTEYLTWAVIDSTMSQYNANKGIVRDSSGSESWTPKARANQLLNINDRLIAITDATPKFTVIGVHDNTSGVYGGSIGMRIDQGGGYIRAFEAGEIGGTITVADNEQYSLLYVNDGGYKIKFQYWDGTAWVNQYTMNAPSGSTGQPLHISFFAYSFGAAWKEVKILRG